MDISKYNPALGFFAFFTFISAVAALAKVFGEPTKNYLFGFIICKELRLKWKFINDKNCIIYGYYFSIIYWILLMMPVITIATWVWVMFYLRRNETYVAPISVLLVSLAGICIIMAQRLIVWKRYKLTWPSIILITLSILLFIAYQLIGNFYYSLDNNFMAISALFLSYNCIIIIILLYLNISRSFLKFEDIMGKFVESTAEDFSPHPVHKDLAQCMEEDLANDKYSLTTPEFESFVTINSSPTIAEASYPQRKQALVNVAVYAFSLGVLGAYSGVAYKTEFEKLGLTISIAVVATDVVLYALYHSEVIGTIGGGCIMAIIFRGCLFGFGGKYWYYGCCVLYALAGVKIAFEKVRQQFPFVENNRRSLKEPIADNRGTNASYKLDILKEPIIAWVFSTLLFALLTVILAFTEPNGVELPSLDLGKKTAPFWFMAILALLLSLLCYFVMATVRLAILRSMKHIPKVSRYFLGEGVGEFWIYIALTYVIIVAAVLVLYYFVRNHLLLAYGVFCPFIAIVLVYCGNKYVENDYAVVYRFRSEVRREQLRQKRTSVTTTRSRMREGVSDFFLSNLSDDTEEETELLQDWRKTANFPSAFFRGLLHTRDYKIIFSLTVCFIATFFLGFTIQMLGSDSPFPDAWIGVTTIIMIVCTILIVGSLFDHLNNGLRMSLPEIFILIAGLGIYLIYAVAFFEGRENGDTDSHYNLYTLPIYAAIYPAVVSCLMGMYSCFARKKISRACYILWACTMLSLGILVIFVYLVWSALEGTIVLLIVGFIALGLVAYIISSYLTLKGKIVIALVVVLMACGVMIYDFCEDRMNNFVGFSISYLLIAGGVFVASGSSIAMTILDWKSSPVIFSPLIFPAFKYKPFLSYPIPYYGKIYTMYISIGAFMVWCLLLSVYVEPVHYGVTAGLFTIVFTLVISIYLSTYTPYNFKLWAEQITARSLCSSWLKAKDRYIKRQGVRTLSELATFRQMLSYKKHLIALNEELAGRNAVCASPRDSSYLGLSYRRKLMWLHNADARIFSLHQSELLLAVLFQMLALMAAQSSTAKEQQDLVRFVRVRKAELKKHGISISLKNVNDLDLRYFWILNQKENLTLEQQIAFNKEWASYQKEKLEKEKKLQAQEKEAQKRLREKFEMEHDEDTRRNIAKYQEIVEDCKINRKKYTDPEFPCTEESLGDSLAVQVSSWKRATDDPSAKIFAGTISPMDLLQGALGDCYLLSAISVMGEKNISLCIKSKEEDAASGAFLVKMYKCGEYEEYLIIDDYFPVGRDNNWLFAQSDMERNERVLEMWPMILEKAYAKLYKSYERIGGGKVHIALAELTGGIPQYIKITDSIQDNIEEFWERLYNYHDSGYMLGAGTPENVRGDSVANENGIVQGHAYAIMDVVDFQGEKLVKLRNPHGSRGIEWNGDWSDESSMWTPAAAEALGLEVEADGVFWMGVNDFVEEFKYVYICCKFDVRWTVVSIDDRCKGNYTLRDNGFGRFPQYEVQIAKPATIFLKMTQSEKHNSYQGKHPIFLILLANNGKKAYTSDTNNMVASSLPPINYVSITTELFADILYTYPYTFTVVAGTLDSTSEFTVRFYSTDPDVQVRKIN